MGQSLGAKRDESFLQPTLIILISGFLALVVVGPLGVIIGQGLSNTMLAIYHVAPWLALAILGAIMPLVVMTGMHWAFAPIFWPLRSQHQMS